MAGGRAWERWGPPPGICTLPSLQVHMVGLGAGTEGDKKAQTALDREKAQPNMTYTAAHLHMATTWSNLLSLHSITLCRPLQRPSVPVHPSMCWHLLIQSYDTNMHRLT